jgi:hypothetical protein
LTTGDAGGSPKGARPLVSEIVIDRDGRLFVSNLSAEVLEALARTVGEDPAFAAQWQALRRYLEQADSAKVARRATSAGEEKGRAP